MYYAENNLKKTKLQWRVSNPKSSRKSLGWIPFKKVAIKYSDGWISYGKHIFKLWDSYGLLKYQVKQARLSKTAVTVGMCV